MLTTLTRSDKDGQHVRIPWCLPWESIARERVYRRRFLSFDMEPPLTTTTRLLLRGFTPRLTT